MKTPMILAAVLALGACAPMAEGDGGAAPTPPGDEADQCRASAYQQYVGRNRSELPTKPANETWRVTCTTCPVTMDFSPQRLNILFEQSTGVIREVKCG